MAATVLSALLLAALLTMTAGLSRDRQRMAAATAAGGGDGPGRHEPVLDLLRRDLANARTMAQEADGGLALVGHGGLAAGSFAPTGRATRVTYRVRRPGGSAGRPCLVRDQQYLDDPARPEPWAEVVAVGVNRVEAWTGAGGDGPAAMGRGDEGQAAEAGDAATGAEPISTRVRVRIEFATGVVDRVLWVR